MMQVYVFGTGSVCYMAGRYGTVQTCDKTSAGPRGWTEYRPS